MNANKLITLETRSNRGYTLDDIASSDEFEYTEDGVAFKTPTLDTLASHDYNSYPITWGVILPRQLDVCYWASPLSSHCRRWH